MNAVALFAPRARQGRRIVLLPTDEVPESATVLGVLVELADVPDPLAAQPGALRAVERPVAPVDERPDRVVVRPGLEVDENGRRVHVDGVEVELTRREFDLLQHVCGRPGRVLTRSQLLQAVWQFDDPRYAGPRTVDVHVSRLRRKLGRHGAALHTLRGVGYRWLP